MQIPVYKPYLYGREKQYVSQCLDSTWISSKGEFIQRFESAFGDFVGAKYATAVCNGTVAIHLALEAIGIGPGDEVIVPTLTYVASVNTIIQAGATPVFVDSLQGTWQIDPADVINKITAKTKAVLVVHLYGCAADMNAISLICKEHKLMLVEDCAEALGTKYEGQHVGTFGDVATFSFFGNKTITTGEGGMVVSNNQRVIETARHLKSQGVSSAKEYWHDVLGYNYRMTNICAAIGLAQLEQIDEILAKKRHIAQWYSAGLAGLPLITHNEPYGTVHSFWMCSIVLNDADIRQSLRNCLMKAGVETRPLFFPAHTLPHCAVDQVFPVAQFLGARGINLPSYPSLSKLEVDHVIETIATFFLETAEANLCQVAPVADYN